MKGLVGNNLMTLVEQRLDNVIYLAGLSLSRSSAKQLISHRHILVNDRILNIPSLNLRENTERPECVEVGASRVVGSSYKKLEEGFKYYLKNRKKWNNPFGDGQAFQIIFNILKDESQYK